MSTFGLVPDPDSIKVISGDPATLRETAQQLTTLSGAFERAGNGFKAINTGGWYGDAADGFHHYLDIAAPKWFRAADAFEAAGKAVADFAATLDNAQRRAQQAWEDFQAARQRSQAARAQHNAAVDRANAGQAPPPPPFVDPAAEEMTAASEAIARAHGDVQAAGDRAAKAVLEAAAEAPAEPGPMTKLKETLVDAHEIALGVVGDIGAGVISGLDSMLQGMRMLNPFDPYNMTHPAGYVENLQMMGQGLAYAATHPTQALKSAVNWEMWQKNPAKAFGTLIPSIVGTAFGAGAVGKAAGVAGKMGQMASKIADASDGKVSETASKVSRTADKIAEASNGKTKTTGSTPANTPGLQWGTPNPSPTPSPSPPSPSAPPGNEPGLQWGTTGSTSAPPQPMPSGNTAGTSWGHTGQPSAPPPPPSPAPGNPGGHGVPSSAPSGPAPNPQGSHAAPPSPAPPTLAAPAEPTGPGAFGGPRPDSGFGPMGSQPEVAQPSNPPPSPSQHMPWEDDRGMGDGRPGSSYDDRPWLPSADPTPSSMGERDFYEPPAHSDPVGPETHRQPERWDQPDAVPSSTGDGGQPGGNANLPGQDPGARFEEARLGGDPIKLGEHPWGFEPGTDNLPEGISRNVEGNPYGHTGQPLAPEFLYRDLDAVAEQNALYRKIQGVELDEFFNSGVYAHSPGTEADIHSLNGHVGGNTAASPYVSTSDSLGHVLNRDGGFNDGVVLDIRAPGAIDVDATLHNQATNGIPYMSHGEGEKVVVDHIPPEWIRGGWQHVTAPDGTQAVRWFDNPNFNPVLVASGSRP